jgi:hypothetical protein
LAIVTDLLDRLRILQVDRAPWEKHWKDVAIYAFPDAERFDSYFADASTSALALDRAMNAPIASERTRDIYDMTSLTAIDRGAAGLLSLVTPQAGTWHDITTDDPYGAEPSDEEQRFYERLRDYLFNTRANPRSGFWMAHKAAVRCVWALGTSVVFIGESDRGVSSPISYHFVPLSENYLGTNFEGVVDTNFRVFRRTARQCVERWGSACSSKVQEMANDAKKKDTQVQILHAVYPRNEGRPSRYRTNRDMPFASCYVEVAEKHLIGEGGFSEFPYRVDHWQRNTQQPYAEGPIALAIADIKSLNLLSKNELIGSSQWVRPPMAVSGSDGDLPPLNLNSGKVNPGYIDDQGRLKAQPITTVQRPDFVAQIIEARRNQVKTTLYIDIWTAIITSPREMTAYEVMVRNTEKGELLGPVGSSLQTGLATQVEREVGILNRKKAFVPGSPLAAPQSLRGRKPGVRFTSPLDRLRRLPVVQGMQQLTTFAGAIAQAQAAAQKPVTAFDKFDFDAMMDEAQEILGVPRKVMVPDEVLAERRNAEASQNAAQQGIAATQMGGEAVTAAATGVESVARSPASVEIIKRLAGITGAAA